MTQTPADEQTPEPETPPDKREIGLVAGKYLVHRTDRSDGVGGKHEDCVPSLFVLDPLHDPRSRQALALYAMLAEADGYLALAEDLRHNLRVIGMVIADEKTDSDTGVRAIATWTYPQVPNHAYVEQVGHDASKALTAAEKAGLDAQGAAENHLGLVDFAGWADPDSLAVHFSPDA